MIQTLNVTQVLLYYDLPQIVVAENIVGTKFLSLLVEANEIETKYIAIEISNNRLASFVNGKLDLREMFLNPEIKAYYYFDHNSEYFEATLSKDVAIPIEHLPENGFVLSKKSDDEVIIKEVIEKNNAVVHLALSDFDDSNSITSDDLADILKSYQQIIENSFKKSVANSNSPKKSFYSIPENYKLRAFASSPGSFNLHLFSTAFVDVFGNSIIDIALKKFDELLMDDQTDDQILISLRSVKGHTISSLKNLLLKIIALNINIKHKWYSPDQNRVHLTIIDKNKAERISGILNAADELSKEIQELVGYFEQVDTENSTWRIVNISDNKEYRGTSLQSLQGIVVDASVLYTLTCEEIIAEGRVSEKEKVTFILLSVTRIE